MRVDGFLVFLAVLRNHQIVHFAHNLSDLQVQFLHFILFELQAEQVVLQVFFQFRI